MKLGGTLMVKVGTFHGPWWALVMSVGRGVCLVVSEGGWRRLPLTATRLYIFI